MTEATPAHPEDPYGIAKLRGRAGAAAARAMFGLDYIIFRPHNVYGPRQNIGDRYRNVVGIFMNQILQGQPMTIFGDGTQTRAFSYIDDVAPLMAESIDRAGGVEPGVQHRRRPARTRSTSWRAAVAAAMGAKPAIVHLPAAARGAARPLRRTPRCARSSAPATPTALEDGLRRMAAWVRAARRPGHAALRAHRDSREPAGRLAEA